MSVGCFLFFVHFLDFVGEFFCLVHQDGYNIYFFVSISHLQNNWSVQLSNS